MAEPDVSQVGQDPLRSLHTSSFPGILDRLETSLLVSTYQAGKLVVLRADQGVLNTHFRAFSKPMGMAYEAGRLAIGTRSEIWEFHNNPGVAGQLEPHGRHDACFLPRTAHVTADMHIHEMAWAGDELHFVNTAFSCLAVRSSRYSFVPTWKPSFITALAPEDRCHLNGMGLRDGQVRYVTALGRCDEPGGWRNHKKDGGMVIDVAAGTIVQEGLAMPHSPRWYDGRLWLLESGTGSLGFIDPQTGRYQILATLPGFTRGLDFCGPIAFVGLSQVRETATFSGLPLTESQDERFCGVWAVNIFSGETRGWVRFEAAVQEIFAVIALPRIRFPDVVNDDSDLLRGSFVLPDDALSEVPDRYVHRSAGPH